VFGGPKTWAERKVAPKPCRACTTVFQPYCGGNLYCEGCKKEAWRATHARSQREWRKKNPQRHAEQKANWDLKRFGLTYADYRRMFVEQGGACAICGTTEPGGQGKTRTLVVDHCHRTDRVRRLLCTCCNSALGMVDDDPEILKKMIAYLQEHGNV
jgi:hypothetical protein